MLSLVKIIGTFMYTGFFPFAPATFASAIFAAIYLWVPGGHWLANPWVALCTLVVSVPVSTRLERVYGHDPGCVVIDEVVGMQVVLVGASGVGVAGVAVAFFLFRLFDIVKPYPANRAQALPTGWGIVIDDVVAGIYTRVALVVVAVLFPALGRFGL